MKSSTPSSSETRMDVRFSKLFAILIILLSHAPLIFGLQQILALRKDFFQDLNFLIPSMAMLVGLLIILLGLSQPNRWYLRLDRDTKVLRISYGIGSRARKYPFDSIFVDGGKLHIEKNGLRKKVGFMRLICNRNDLKVLVSALEAPSAAA